MRAGSLSALAEIGPALSETAAKSQPISLGTTLKQTSQSLWTMLLPYVQLWSPWSWRTKCCVNVLYENY
mgnify:CR=1 FL=1